MTALSPYQAEIQSLCRRHHVRHLEGFGSAGRAESLDEVGDADMRVELEDGHLSAFDRDLDLTEPLEAFPGAEASRSIGMGNVPIHGYARAHRRGGRDALQGKLPERLTAGECLTDRTDPEAKP